MQRNFCVNRFIFWRLYMYNNVINSPWVCRFLSLSPLILHSLSLSKSNMTSSLIMCLSPLPKFTHSKWQILIQEWYSLRNNRARSQSTKLFEYVSFGQICLGVLHPTPEFIRIAVSWFYFGGQKCRTSVSRPLNCIIINVSTEESGNSLRTRNLRASGHEFFF